MRGENINQNFFNSIIIQLYMCKKCKPDDRGIDIDEVIVIINGDGSVYPFVELYNPLNESDEELRKLIDDYLEKQGRKIGTFYKTL